MAGTAIALIPRQSPGTARGWLARMRSGGLDPLRDKAKRGWPPKIDSNPPMRTSDTAGERPAGRGTKSNV